MSNYNELIKHLSNNISETAENIDYLESSISLFRQDLTNDKLHSEIENSIDVINASIKNISDMQCQLKLIEVQSIEIDQHYKNTKSKYFDEITKLLINFRNLKNDFNQLSSLADISTSSQLTTPLLTNDSSVYTNNDIHSIIIDMDNENTNELSKIKNNLNNTNLIFDELSQMIQQQKSHLSILETNMVDVQQVTRNGINELQTAAFRKRVKNRRILTLIAVVTLISFCILYSRSFYNLITESFYIFSNTKLLKT